MTRRLTRKQEEQAEVNITPLLDIVFILLIFFIVTSTFLQEQGFGLNSPSDEPPEDDTRPPPTLMLSVQADGFVRVNNVRLIDPRSVKPVVEEFTAREPRGVVLVNAAPKAKAETTVTVLDQARLAGVEPAVGLQESRR
ncbi:biopolymer transport protein ExbD/TolR [Salinisphaera sp. PC39]|uniref:ExbD/TolR family protein n=1 Tax=Salinisphaera sp. PC39 TaxID=1304156 RepID=UPI00333F5303